MLAKIIQTYTSINVMIPGLDSCVNTQKTIMFEALPNMKLGLDIKTLQICNR